MSPVDFAIPASVSHKTLLKLHTVTVQGSWITGIVPDLGSKMSLLLQQLLDTLIAKHLIQKAKMDMKTCL